MTDIIGIELDHEISWEVERLRRNALKKIKEHFLFQRLISSANKARAEDNEQLAHALLEAKLAHMPIAHIVEQYAQRFIYPHRVKPADTLKKYHS